MIVPHFTEPCESEIEREFRYRYWERIGILCGTADPTPEEHKIALNEASEWKYEALAEEMAAKL